MTTEVLYDKKVTCLYCEESFTTKKVRPSKVVIIKKDPDFCIHYQGENPYYYEIFVCPKCGFAFTANYSPLNEEKRGKLKGEYIERTGILQLCGPRNWEDALKSVKLALVTSFILKEPWTTLAGLSMRVAWLYREKGNSEEEKKYLAKAHHSYGQAYELEDLESMTMGKYRLYYILGELSGRLANYEDTRRWFNLLLSDKNVEQALKNTARSRWEIYKESIQTKVES